LTGINPSLAVEAHEVPLSASNALDLIRRYDLVIDGTDNFATRYLVNDACVMVGRPNVYGSIFRFEGQASVLAAADGPCYRCLYPEPPPPGLIPSCGEAGVLGVLPGVIGAIQATEAIKLITGAGEPLIGRFLIYDALRLRFRELTLRKDPDCPVCGTHPTIRHLTDAGAACAVPPSAHKEPATMNQGEVSATDLKSLLDRGEVTLIDVREPSEYRICQIPGAALIPLGELPRRVAEIDQSRPVVVHCKSGARSAQAVAWLRRQGFTDVRNMRGGILAWINEVDPSLPKY
jgi:adenylyltransferase/sulfurtransferase